MTESSPALYPYTQRSLLDVRYHYMYTPFEGIDFLRGYCASRNDLRQRIAHNCAQALGRPPNTDNPVQTSYAYALLQAFEIHSLSDAVVSWAEENNLDVDLAQNRKSTVLPSRPYSREFVTVDLLLDLLNVRLFRAEKDENLPWVWAEVLLKKFEVCKRVYSAYTKALKPRGTKYDCLLVYALLSVILMSLYERRKNLKHLNAVLKLNDLIGSAWGIDQSFVTQVAVLVALDREMGSVLELVTEQGVSL